MRFFFIDLENVRSEGLEGVGSLSDTDMVFIYYSENAMNLSIPTLENLNNSRASKKFIKTNYIGKNAMDFQIVSLFGAMIERKKEGSYYIISQDNGFRSAVSFCESYFADYGIRCGVYPTIISAITADMKAKPASRDGGKAKKAAPEAAAPEPEQNGEETAAKKKRRRRKKSSAPAEAAQSSTPKEEAVQKNEPKEEPAAQASGENKAAEIKSEGKLGYIYRILGELLSEKTISIYADSIDEAIAKCKNRNELHEFYHQHFGADEGEALYKITQGDFEKMKQERPSRSSRTRRRPKKKAQTENTTVS